MKFPLILKPFLDENNKLIYKVWRPFQLRRKTNINFICSAEKDITLIENDEKPKMVTGEKQRRFPQPSLKSKYTSVTFGIPHKNSTGMHVFFSDEFREINISVAKYKMLHDEIRGAFLNKKKNLCFLIIDKFKLPSANDNRYITKYCLVNLGSAINDNNSKVMLVQSYHKVNNKDVNQFIEESSFGIGLPMNDFIKVNESIHQTRGNIESFEEAEKLDF